MDEISKAAPDAIMLAAATQLFARLVGKPLDEAGELVTDFIRSWRYEIQLHNYIKLMERTKEKLAARGIQASVVPSKVLFPLLDAATLEEEPLLQEMWSSLLADVSDPEVATNLGASYVEILKQISPAEAKIVKFLYSGLHIGGDENADWVHPRRGG